jgi:hypothetical protein
VCWTLKELYGLSEDNGPPEQCIDRSRLLTGMQRDKPAMGKYEVGIEVDFRGHEKQLVHDESVDLCTVSTKLFDCIPE